MYALMCHGIDSVRPRDRLDIPLRFLLILALNMGLCERLICFVFALGLTYVICRQNN